MNPEQNPRQPDKDLLPEMEAWFQAHPNEDRASLEHMWHQTAFLQEQAHQQGLPAARIDEMEAQIAAAIKAKDHPRAAMSRIHVLRRWTVAAAVAAGLVLVFIASFALQPVQIAAPAGEFTTVHLPEGTTVTLNSGSRLTYRRPFQWFTRRVSLHGEAFFDVTPGATPFVVETFNGAVTVLGTRFNVRAWPENSAPATEVILEEGQVQLRAGVEHGAWVVLQPGQVSRVVAGERAPTVPVSVAVGAALSWREGGFRFMDTPLGDILDELERRTDVKMLVSDPALRDLRATLILETVEGPEAVLDVLAAMRNFTYQRTPEGYRLTMSSSF